MEEPPLIIKLVLTVEQIQILNHAMGELPLKHVIGVYGSVKQQTEVQIAEYERLKSTRSAINCTAPEPTTMPEQNNG